MQIKLTKFPSEIDTPASLKPDLVELRNEALKQGDFKYAVHLSHVHAWLYWLDENMQELVRLRNAEFREIKKKTNRSNSNTMEE